MTPPNPKKFKSGINFINALQKYEGENMTYKHDYKAALELADQMSKSFIKPERNDDYECADVLNALYRSYWETIRSALTLTSLIESGTHVLVPVKATDEMLREGNEASECSFRDAEQVYDAMINAAPKTGE
jgi:hypothetical protein